jgi:hypothetical protein
VSGVNGAAGASAASPVVKVENGEGKGRQINQSVATWPACCSGQ